MASDAYWRGQRAMRERAAMYAGCGGKWSCCMWPAQTEHCSVGVRCAFPIGEAIRRLPIEEEPASEAPAPSNS